MSDLFANSRIVVTGGSGFVGSHFVDALLDRGARVLIPVHQTTPAVDHPNCTFIPADLTSETEALKVCEGADCLMHCAGPVGASGVGAEKAMHGIVQGLVLLGRTLHAAWAQGVKRVLIFGSSTGYPELDHPVREEEFWSGDVYPGYLGYGWMRRYLEKLGEYVQRESSTQVTIVRPVAVYGPRDNFDPASCHVIPALIRRAVEGENPYVVWGRGDVVRDFLHIRDFVRGSLLALERLPGADPVNIACGRRTTVAEVVAAILKATGREDLEVRFDESRPTALPFRMADTSKARELLGFEPEISLEEGLRETVRWFVENRG